MNKNQPKAPLQGSCPGVVVDPVKFSEYCSRWHFETRKLLVLFSRKIDYSELLHVPGTFYFARLINTVIQKFLLPLWFFVLFFQIQSYKSGRSALLNSNDFLPYCLQISSTLRTATQLWWFSYFLLTYLFLKTKASVHTKICTFNENFKIVLYTIISLSQKDY